MDTPDHAADLPLPAPIQKTTIALPFGLIGLRHLTRFELDPIVDSWPFVRMRALDGADVELVVVEPNTVLESYPLEISDEDAESLGLEDGNSALVLNIVCIHSLNPHYVTVNLVGPVVVNRQTLIGKQVIAANPERHSVAHVLVDLREPPVEASVDK